jgi:hypothetical protein
MRNSWVWLVVVLGSAGCKGNEGAAPAASGAPAAGAAAARGAPGAAPAGTAPAKKPDKHGCSTEVDFLLPPQKYQDADLVRAILVDGDHVYFRNMLDVFKMPLAGGQPAPHSKGPGLLLFSKPVMWASGDRLLTQSAGEPIFMGVPKAGGSWTNFIDLTAAKLGGGRDVTTRILQGIGGAGRSAAKASQASFDGQAFYWAETTKQGKGPNAPETSVVKSVPLAGGEARALYQARGDIDEVVRAGDRIAFIHKAPPSPEQLQKQAADRKAKKIVFGVRGESQLMSIPLDGGEPKKLMRIANMMAGALLGADGNHIYVSGYADEDAAKPGIYRIDASGTTPPQRLDSRVLTGNLYVSGDTIVLIGDAMLEPTSIQSGQFVLTGSRSASALTQAACIADGYTLHASALSKKIALLGLFKTATQLASIARLQLL